MTERRNQHESSERRRAGRRKSLDALLAGKATDDDKLLWKWVRQFIDLHDHNLGGPGKIQVPNEALERHLNSSPRDLRHRLQKLHLYNVQHHRQGRATIHGKCRFSRSAPAVIIRVDADAHQPGQSQLAAEAFIERLKVECSCVELYDEQTARGHAAYAVLDIAPYPEPINGKTIFPARWRINETIRQTAVALKSLAVAWGFNIDVELQGGFTLTTGERGEKRIRHRAHPMRLPLCPRPGDGGRLEASRFGDTLLHEIIRLSNHIALPAPETAPEPKAVRRALNELDRRVRAVFAVIDPGDKHRRRVQCVRDALREVLPASHWDGTAISTAHEAAVIERANVLYHERGYNGGRRDHARGQAFRRILAWLFETYDPEAKGDGGKGGGLRFGYTDIKRADELARSMISQADLYEINRDPKLKRCRLTYRHLAIAICTAAKNTQTSNGAVPTTSIQGMLRWFGLPTNGSQAAVIFSLLVRKRLLRCTHAAYGPGFCCKYAPAGQVWSLPFISEMKPADRAAADQQAARYHQAAGGGQQLTTLYLSSTFALMQPASPRGAGF
jgi:hypothetical protein